jgi:hypothetical protein
MGGKRKSGELICRFEFWWRRTKRRKARFGGERMFRNRSGDWKKKKRTADLSLQMIGYQYDFKRLKKV